MSPFGRPTFDVAGRVVARREMRMGDRTYAPGQELAAGDREQFCASRLATLWQLGTIDTMPSVEPSDAELERLTAPSRQQPKSAPARR